MSRPQNYLSIAEFDAALENGPYAWPGGYPLFFVMGDGEAMSFVAAKANQGLMRDAITGENPDIDWLPVAFVINWEDDDLFCCHTGDKIEAAYEPDDDEEEPDS